MHDAIHSLVPNLRVSPSRSPSWLTAEVVASIDHCEGMDAEETTNI
jgi:hypothetical protein